MRDFASILHRGLRRLRATAAASSSWTCVSCRHEGQVRFAKSFSQSSSKNKLDVKPYYVTTPIFYVNASPHVGHLYSMVLADVLKRWEVLKGERPAYLCTGTDEHGMKVQQAAALQEVSPKTLCDSNSETFKDLARKANLSNDFFIRTTDPEHRNAVEYFWQRLRDNGFIYETKHEGWYCVSDETFYPENMVTKQVSPTTGKQFMASTETGNAVEWTEEKNYHFRMTALKERLLEFYKENPEWVVPANRMADVVNWVENNLEDLSISRPVNRLTWGIPVPDDESQTIYVWVDALINYITVAGYPNWTPGSEHFGGWPADVHVIGKDIVRFHCVYWPALLLALDMPLPKRVLSHGHWLMGQRKMSKSVGNVVNPFFAIERWGVDTMRYFLIINGGIVYDADYNNEFIVEDYKKGLQGGLGNLLNRTTRPKNWNVRQAIEHEHEKMSQEIAQSCSPTKQEKHLVDVKSLVEDAAHEIEKLNTGRALQRVMEIVYVTQKYFHHSAPWELAKKGDTERLLKVVYCAAESLRITGILLQPFMPEKSAEFLDRLGVDPSRRSLADAKIHADATYGVPLIPLGEGAQSSLFPPIAYEE